MLGIGTYFTSLGLTGASAKSCSRDAGSKAKQLSVCDVDLGNKATPLPLQCKRGTPCLCWHQGGEPQVPPHSTQHICTCATCSYEAESSPCHRSPQLRPPQFLVYTCCCDGGHALRQQAKVRICWGAPAAMKLLMHDDQLCSVITARTKVLDVIHERWMVVGDDCLHGLRPACRTMLTSTDDTLWTSCILTR
jgi:hypothetical protein